MEEAKNETRPNGEIVVGDCDYDGRVILYVIKGQLSHPGETGHRLILTQPIKHRGSTTSSQSSLPKR